MYSFSSLESVYCSKSSSNSCYLTCTRISQEAGQVVWYSHLFQNFPQFIVIHTVKGFGLVNKAEIDVFLELSCFFDDPVDGGNLISGSFAFSKTSLNNWKFKVHILLKPGLENFEHYFTSSQQRWPTPTSSNTHWTPVTLCCLLVALLCPPLWDPMDCSPPGSSVLPPAPSCLTKKERQGLCTDYTWPLERIWFKRLFSRKGSQIVF